MATITKGPQWTQGPASTSLTPQEREALRKAMTLRRKADPRIVAELSVPWRGFVVAIRLGEVAGRLECVGLDVLADPEQPTQPALTALGLRELRLGELVDRTRLEYRQAVELAGEVDAASGAWNSELTQQEREEIANSIASDVRERLPISQSSAPDREMGRPKMYGGRHYELVAKTYAASMSRHPTQDVAKEFGVSKSAAAKWVARARDLGLLTPTTRGKRSASLVVGTPSDA